LFSSHLISSLVEMWRAVSLLRRRRGTPAERRWLGGVVLAALLGTIGGVWLLRWLNVRRRRALTGESAESAAISDPTLPVSLEGATTWADASKRAGKDIWEWYLDSLRFDPNTPTRQHLRSVIARAEVREQLDVLFEHLCDEAGMVSEAAFTEGVSASLRGTVHVLLRREQRTQLLPPAEQELEWLRRRWEQLWPKGMDREGFRECAKLVMVRRLVRTLIQKVGYEKLRSGLETPLVFDIQIASDLHIHTVAPARRGGGLGPLPETPPTPKTAPSPRAPNS